MAVEKKKPPGGLSTNTPPGGPALDIAGAPGLSRGASTTKIKDDKLDIHWWGYGIPFRPARGTYELYRATDWPIVDTKPFAHLTTVDDVWKHREALEKQVPSLTACGIVEPTKKEPDLFYLDSQGCLKWACDAKTGQVYEMYSNKIVAKSLAEFWSRLYMETSISKPINPRTDLYRSTTDLWGPVDSQAVWTSLNGTSPPVSYSKAQLAYLEFFYKLSN